ncbi:hypothetical protein LTR36_000631 [Oleoguttula mirabilis]|uniref:Uncharacterized protein n=1 Tax=Oleoguttula mirabilis TaxID=1507867 RepID=A0AAV9JQN8_9PEZI|nr:hypothetical protein LTR36_000631 [Oleoguttula mirabilis]
MEGRLSHSRRRYMDDTVYRSASTSPLGYTDLMDPRVPRYSSNVAFEDQYRTSYFDRGHGDSYCDRGYGDSFQRRSLSPYDQGFYGYEGESRWGGDEVIRRTNREVAVANGAITRPSPNIQLHPMMTAEGRYPTNYTIPRRLQEFVHMGDSELDRIMVAYDLGASRSRYYRGNLMDSFSDSDVFHGSKSEKRRNLIALFEFLGAH